MQQQQQPAASLGSTAFHSACTSIPVSPRSATVTSTANAAPSRLAREGPAAVEQGPEGSWQEQLAVAAAAAEQQQRQKQQVWQRSSSIEGGPAEPTGGLTWVRSRSASEDGTPVLPAGVELSAAALAELAKHRRSSAGLHCASIVSLAAWQRSVGSRQPSTLLPGGLDLGALRRYSSVALQPGAPPAPLGDAPGGHGSPQAPLFGLGPLPESPRTRPASARSNNGGASTTVDAAAATATPPPPLQVAGSGGGHRQRRSPDARDGGEASAEAPGSVGSSRLGSFNSEEGFGSPVKHKREHGWRPARCQPAAPCSPGQGCNGGGPPAWPLHALAAPVA